METGRVGAVFSSSELDPLETCRGAIASWCWTPTPPSREIHVTRLHRLFEHIDIERESLESSLQAIAFIREVERLGQGYLSPTPIRRIDLGIELSLIVAVQPTEELKRHFTSIRRVGTGRICAQSEAAHLAAQPLFDWSGADGLNASEWMKQLIEHSSEMFVESVLADGLEVFSTKSSTTGNQIRRVPHWHPIGADTRCIWKGISLLRQRTGPSTYRQFLGRFVNGRLFEGRMLGDARRAQFAIATLSAEPLTATWHEQDGEHRIQVPTVLPHSERRLFAALCEEVPGSYGYKWICRVPELASVIRSALKRLDCEVI